MKTTETTIAGVPVRMAYCYATELAFFRATGKGVELFDPADPMHIKEAVMAAVNAAYAQGGQPPIDETKLEYEATPEEITAAVVAFFTLQGQWYRGADKVEARKTGEGGEEPTKNA